MSNQIIEHRYWVSQQVKLCRKNEVLDFVRSCRNFESEKIISYIRFSNAAKGFRLAIKNVFFLG
ncbi:hypothetical protein HC752_21530 [Vibrio sp. S9_S30]|uniref:hypothetical protein n=1 Tax=Vibrio sp. S9_S30 TaxID=2720226 RepID=UPI001681B8A7|nr:hypothetical protein [Vibrio sp. S9_S30]MBD1559528.1 hypothetical protein [Vibrio sp. S9_S30]